MRFGVRSQARAWTAGAASIAALAVAGCARPPEPAAPVPEPEPLRLVELLEGVRADPERGVVEFDGVVAIDCHDPETPDVYLEVICCNRDTREHEALVVTTVRPSLVHAALLAAGAEPGSPGGWRQDGETLVPVPARGDPVVVTLVVRGADGAPVEHDPAAWIREAGGGRTLRELVPDSAWVFAGSRMRRFRGAEVYDADGTGQLVGLHTFGSETIAWTHVESPDSWIDEPRWLADARTVPPIGTPVTVRLRLGPDVDSP